MDLPKTIKAIFPANTAKELARRLGVPVNTAREWIYRRVSGAREQDIVNVLLAEFERQDRVRAELHREILLEQARLRRNRNGIECLSGRYAFGSPCVEPLVRSGI